MKFNDVLQKLKTKNPNYLSSINDHYKNEFPLEIATDLTKETKTVVKSKYLGTLDESHDLQVENKRKNNNSKVQDIQIIGITGSKGKSSVKRLINAILMQALI